MTSSASLESNPTRGEYYKTNSKRKGVLGHLSFGVASIAISEKFYTAILAPFGISVVYSNPTRSIIGYGLSADEEVFTLFERGKDARSPGLGTHFAFNAPSRQAVREFWEAGVQNGGESDGEAGLRKHYGENYFAAFLLDPDGFRLEAVFQDGVEI